jgi:hypothetical protein
VRRRQAARHDPLRRPRCAQSAQDGPAAVVPRRREKAWFLDRLKSSRASWKIWGRPGGAGPARAWPNAPP